MRPTREIWMLLNAVATLFAAVSALRPQNSETRFHQTLDGRWHFMLNPNGQISAQEVHGAVLTGNFSDFGQVVYDMPVPGSFNDITMNKTVKNFIGWSFFWHAFYLPALLASASNAHHIFLQFDSANYYCDVFLNGKLLVSHEGGHLPFEAEITSYLTGDGFNTLVVALNNTLNATTVPPAQFLWLKGGLGYPPNYTQQVLNMDFYNYGGIQRSVHLLTKPKAVYIGDIHLRTVSITDSNIAMLNWTVQLQFDVATSVRLTLQLLDAHNTPCAEYEVVTSSATNEGQMKVLNANYWWPNSLGIDINGNRIALPNGATSGYLYTMQVSVLSEDSEHTLYDRYRLKTGIRTVRLTDRELLINEHPLYCVGVNMHEDADIRGRGFDMSTLLRNFEALKWLGVNCVRTSHYPYAEEFLDLADQVGIAIFDEVPAVGLVYAENYVERTFTQHCRTIVELVSRDRNRPCVVGWSLANEPNSNLPAAGDYFSRLFAFARAQDPHSGRPLIYTIGSGHWDTDRAAPYADITALNRYDAWYSDLARIELIELQIGLEVNNWYTKYQRPLMFTEFGAEAISGLHKWPAVVFSEEFQVEFLDAYQRTFDALRRRGVPLIGELIWNFADFETDQSISRVDGNHKGLFTRQRQPKMAAHYVR